MPSRTKKQPRHGIKFISVPVEGTDRKVGIAHSISTDHTCGRKRFAIRYKDHDEKESSHVFTFCAHEIAAHLVILDFYMHTKKNMTPLEMNQFAIPTQETVDYYLNLMNRCLIQTSFDVDPRKLSKAEMEILLWDLVQQEGHDSTFFATKDPKEYRWQLAT